MASHPESHSKMDKGFAERPEGPFGEDAEQADEGIQDQLGGAVSVCVGSQRMQCRYEITCAEMS